MRVLIEVMPATATGLQGMGVILESPAILRWRF
jgi:hypothetical protein